MQILATTVPATLATAPHSPDCLHKVTLKYLTPDTQRLSLTWSTLVVSNGNHLTLCDRSCRVDHIFTAYNYRDMPSPAALTQSAMMKHELANSYAKSFTNSRNRVGPGKELSGSMLMTLDPGTHRAANLSLLRICTAPCPNDAVLSKANRFWYSMQ